MSRGQDALIVSHTFQPFARDECGAAALAMRADTEQRDSTRVRASPRLEGPAPQEGLAEQQLRVLVGPVLRRQRLQEDDDRLCVCARDAKRQRVSPVSGADGSDPTSERAAHAPESPSRAACRSTAPGTPSTRTGGTRRRRLRPRPVSRKLAASATEVRRERERERERATHEVGVPHADDVLDAELAHEEAVHPSERKLDELDALLLEVRRERGCGTV